MKYLKFKDDSVAGEGDCCLVETGNDVFLEDSEDTRLPKDEEKGGCDDWKFEVRSESFQWIVQAIEDDHEIIVSYIWRYADDPVH